jgi:hypothetical protein
LILALWRTRATLIARNASDSADPLTLKGGSVAKKTITLDIATVTAAEAHAIEKDAHILRFFLLTATGFTILIPSTEPDRKSRLSGTTSTTTRVYSPEDVALQIPNSAPKIAFLKPINVRTGAELA